MQTESPQIQETQQTPRSRTLSKTDNPRARVNIYTAPNGSTQIAWSDGKKRHRKTFGGSHSARRAEKEARNIILGWTGPRKLYRPSVSEEGQVVNNLSYRRRGGLMADGDPLTLRLFSQFINRYGDKGLISLISSHAKKPVLPHVSVGTAVRLFLESANGRNLSAAYLSALKLHLTRFAEAFVGDLEDITTLELDDYLRSISDAPRTCQSHRLSIKQLFSFAQRKQWLNPNQPTVADTTERFKAPPSEPCIFTPAEMIRLLAAADPITQAYLVICGFAGVRRSEAERMTWGAISIENKSLILSCQITKTSRRRVCALEPNAVEWLTPMVEGKNPQERICGGPIRARLDNTVRSAKVEWKQNALRHSYVSYHLELFGNAPMTAKNAGHDVAVLEQHYLQLVHKSTAAEWFNIRPSSIIHE